jgi:hypothetical protein
MDEAVKVRDSLVWQGVRPCVWVILDLHNFRVGWGQGRVNPRGWHGRLTAVLRRPLVSDRGLI